ncbi:hypothetical protein K432DRAFT_300664 [Lepidopterella palustris CBS 459.81]|uniref:Rhodopsin domain-containing protein n=1 Tax=Lepidopterella palustris CBS 459.81 TaxID=1314670 RepID=A0A8E2JDW3_9PEZI|nr:hypothetical protein K432DRAFT_300664 [Lepidopterella palustris CBS 459.81]
MLASPTAAQLLTESVIFWVISFVIFVGRIWSRAISKKSILNIQADDYVMIVTFCCYTALLVLLEESGRYGTNEVLPDQLAAVLADPKQVAKRIHGSKIVVGSNQCYLMTLWGVKTCLLTLYRRTPQNTFVKFVIGYCILGLLAIEIPYFFVFCRPFSNYWALPVDNPQCYTYHTYCIVQTVFNISSDMLMLAIPIPLIIKANVPPAKKALLFGIFSLGIFVILAAILNKYYNFANSGTTIYMVWHIREASTSVIVANLMCWWPLLQKLFGLRAFIRSAGSKRSGTGDNGLSGTEGLKGPRRIWPSRRSKHFNSVDLERLGSQDAINTSEAQYAVEIEGISANSEDGEDRNGLGKQWEGFERSIIVTTKIEKTDGR